MRWAKRFIIFVVLLGGLSPGPAFAVDDAMGSGDAAEKARKAHEMAATDIIYQQEEWKAMYYQNIQIIQLLKEIRDSLQTMRARDTKTEEKE